MHKIILIIIVVLISLETWAQYTNKDLENEQIELLLRQVEALEEQNRLLKEQLDNPASSKPSLASPDQTQGASKKSSQTQAGLTSYDAVATL